MGVGRTGIEEEASESLLMREAALGVLMSPLSVCSFTSVFVVISFTIPPASGPFANSLLAIPSTNSLLAIPSTNSLSSTCPFHPSTLSCVMMVHRHVAQNGRVLHHDRSLGDEVVHQLHRRRGGVSDDLEVPILGRQMLVDALRLNVGGSNARDSDASVRSRRSVTCGWVRTSPQLRSAVSPRSPPLDSGRVPRE